MKSQNFEDFISRTKQLMQQSNLDTPLKPNVSETIEKTVSGSDGKTYAIVRENKKFYIKESTDGSSFNYIGGSANKRDFEYQSYNAASKNLELKMRSINEAINNNGVFETFEKPTQAEYMVEATEDMRGEIDRFRQIVNGVNCIMNESKVEFVSKPKIKDAETEKIASDPKKQGTPFVDIAKATLDKDQITKNIKPEDADTPFDCKPKSNLNDGKCVNSKKNKSVIVTEKQMEMIQKKINEGLYDDDDFETYDDDDEYDLLKKFDYPEINKLGKTYTPTKIDLEDLPSDDDDEEVYDNAEEDDDMVDEGIFDTVKAVGSVGRQFGKTLKNAASNVGKQVSQTYNKSLAQSSQAEIDKIANKLKSELITLNDRTVKSGGEPLNYNSVIVALSNKLRGQLGRQSFESNNEKKIYAMIDKVVNEVISEKKKIIFEDDERVTLTIPNNQPKQNKVNNVDQVNPFKRQKFDAGIDVDEDENPKNYIEKLTGKLAQKIRTYNDNNPDSELSKFVINSLIPATIPSMSDEDVKDVVDKVEENKPKGRSEVRDIQNDEDVVNEIVDKIIKNRPSTNFNIRNPYKPKKFK